MIVFRPRIVAHEAADPSDSIMATVFMMEYIRANFFIPGQVENWVQIIDLGNLSLLNLPYKVTSMPYYIVYIVAKDIHRHPPDPVPVHVGLCLHTECVHTVQLYMEHDQGLPRRASEEEDPHY